MRKPIEILSDEQCIILDAHIESMCHVLHTLGGCPKGNDDAPAICWSVWFTLCELVEFRFWHTPGRGYPMDAETCYLKTFGESIALGPSPV